MASRYKKMAKEVWDWEAGKVRLPTFMVEADGPRTAWKVSGPEA